MISIQTMLVTSSTLLVISDHFERHGRISVLRSSLWLPAESPEGCGQTELHMSSAPAPGPGPVHAKPCGDLDWGFCQSTFRRVLPVGAAVAFSSKCRLLLEKSKGTWQASPGWVRAISSLFSKLIDGNGNIIAPGSWAGIMCRTLIVMYIEFRRPRCWNGGEYEWKVCFYSPIHY